MRRISDNFLSTPDRRQAREDQLGVDDASIGFFRVTARFMLFNARVLFRMSGQRLAICLALLHGNMGLLI